MDEIREQLPAKTTPTWEMELLVSGATIVGLLQLPDLLDRLYFRVINLSPQAYYAVLTPLWVYTKVTVATLVLTFLTHICLRGYWVALVGMASVYPGGIHWERLGLGPVALECVSAEGNIEGAIERADNRATRVFGVGVSIAMLMAGLSSIALLALVAALCVDVFLGEGYTKLVFGTVVALIVVPWALSSVLDRRYGHRLFSASGSRTVGPIAGLFARWGAGPRANPLIALFRSQVGRVKFLSVTTLVLLPIFLVVASQRVMANGSLPFGLFVGLSASDPGASTVSPAAFYEDERGDPWSMMPLPHIRTRVASGPYVQLFVPFIPRLQGRDLPVSCPELSRAGAADARRRLECLARMTALQLDGAPLAVSLQATTDAATGQPGVVAMVPVGALAAGRHEISLNSPDHGESEVAARRRYRIAFWK
jgi:hypothetical protein